MNNRNILLLVILAVVSLVFFMGYTYTRILDKSYFLVNEDITTLKKISLIFYGYFTLIAGVFLGSVYRALKALRGQEPNVNIKHLLSKVLKGVDFWLGAFASPVVYIILLQAIDLQNLSFAGVIGVTLVGLQNGFVCNTIADSLITA